MRDDLFLRWVPAAKNLFKYSLNLVLPKSCVLCKKPLPFQSEGSVCFHCWKGMMLVESILCKKCGLPGRLIGENPHAEAIGECGWCLKWNYEFDEARAVGIYQGHLKEIIHMYKYNHMIHLATDILRLVIEHFPPEFKDSTFDYLIPVPLHPKKLREREYNQTAILAEGLSATLNIQVKENILVRKRYTPPQISLSGEERWQNVKNAFEIRDTELLKNKSLLLLDDVFTTGATISECARSLRKAHPARISVLTIARAIQ